MHQIHQKTEEDLVEQSSDKAEYEQPHDYTPTEQHYH
jgi:hypothetical protein